MMQVDTGGTEETLESFSRSLDELTVNSKPLINILSGVAAENISIAAAIVNVVKEHLEKAPSAITLPILYLIDSIIKNVGGDYIHLFSPTLKDSFSTIFSKADKTTRYLMCHLRQSWGEFLSSQDLSFIDKQVHALDPHWLINMNTLDSPESHSVKILVNPVFLPPTKNENSEDDDEEILREQLIQQMRKRKLEKDQTSKNKESKSEELNPANCTESENTSKIQADSTTVEKLGTSVEGLKQYQSLSPSTSAEDSKTLTKPVNKELLKILSNLVVESNKIQIKKEERQTSLNYGEVHEDRKRERKEYRKREKPFKQHTSKTYKHSCQQDDRYYHKYSSRREDKHGSRQEFVESESNVFKKAKHSSLFSSCSQKDKSCYSSQRICISPLLQVSSDCDTPSSINSDCMGVYDFEKVLPGDYSPPLKRKNLEKPLLTPVENSGSIPVLNGYSHHQRIVNHEGSPATSYSDQLKPKYSLEENSFLFCPNFKKSRHEDVPVEVKPVKEIDYKHGCGAPVKKFFRDLNRTNENVHCSDKLPCSQVSFPVSSVHDHCQSSRQACDSKSHGMRRFNSFVPPTTMQHLPERMQRDSWGSKIMTQDLSMECNMVNFPSFANNLMPVGFVQGAVNSMNVDTLTTQVRFHSENTHYSGDVTSGTWLEGVNSPLPSLLQLPQPFFKKGGKKRHRSMQNLKRRASREYQNAQNHLQTLCASETYEMSHKSSSSNELINESSSGVGINSKSSCSTIQPSEVSTSVNSAVFRPCDNVHALFQSLCEKGLLIPSSLQNETEKEEIKKVEVYAVDFRDVLSFRRRQPKIIEELHNGTQCNSCGARFITEYSDHLDWHFNQNHRIKDSKCSQSRKWYCSRKQWVQRESNGIVKQKVSVEQMCKAEESSVPSKFYKRNTVCEVCNDGFEEFFNEDHDEWHLRDCLSNDGLPYHPTCFKDISSAPPHSRFHLDGQDNSKQCDSRLQSSETIPCDGAMKDHEVENCNLVPDNCISEGPAHEQILEKQPRNAEGLLFQVRSTECEVSKVAQKNVDIEGVKENELNDGDTANLLHDHVKLSCDISLCEVKGTASELEKKEQSDLSSESECGAIKQFDLGQSSRVQVEDCRESSGDGVEVNPLDSLLLTTSNGCSREPNVSVLKPAIIGRKLTNLPPSMKGSETSNLCCVS